MSSNSYVESVETSEDDVIEIEPFVPKRRSERSRAPSPIDTHARPARRAMAFHVRDFEDRNAPLMFLDSYVQKFKGWPNMRSRAIIPEQFIKRLPFKSPCLRHDHDSGLDDENLEDAAVAQDIGQIATIDDEIADAGHVEQEEIDFSQDPSYLRFMRRIDQMRHLRRHRYHPLSRYDNENECKDCFEADLLPRPHPVTESDRVSLGQRYVEALNDLEVDNVINGRRCPVCDQVGEIHWASHRAYHMQQVYDERSRLATDNCEVESVALRLARLRQGDSQQTMRFLEEMCHLAENEVLEREEFCRICYESFEYGSGELFEHYKIHQAAEQEDRNIMDTWLEHHDDDALVEETASHLSSPSSPATPANVRARVAALLREAKMFQTQSVQRSPGDRSFFALDSAFGLVSPIVDSSDSSVEAASTSARKGTPSSKRGRRDFSFARSPRAAIFAKQHGKKSKAPVSPATTISSGSGRGRRKAVKRVDSVLGSRQPSTRSNGSRPAKVQRRRRST